MIAGKANWKRKIVFSALMAILFGGILTSSFSFAEDSAKLRSTKVLRDLISKGMVVAPFCLNAYHAKIAQSVGFKAIYMTGFGTAAERGYPDVGLITQTEMIQNARYIIDAVNIPVICDADTGYGNAINVWRTVREYEAIGAAAIHLEDQVFPKKCGFFEGKELIPMEEHVQKIRAALDARRDKNFVIIARCDALAVSGWAETVRRCRAYYKAGADVVFVDGIKTMNDLKDYARELQDLPKLYNGMLASTQEVEKMGFKIMITGGTNQLIFVTLKRAFQELMKNGIVSSERLGERKDWEEMTKVLGLPAIYEMQKRYAVDQK